MYIDNFRNKMSIASSIFKSLLFHLSGDHTKVEVTLQERMVMTGGQSFTIRENNATVATGVVTKVLRSVEIPMKRLDKVDFEKFLN